MANDIIQVESKYYISVNSTYADDRTMVLNHIDTFGIFDRWGDMKQIGEEVQGIYYNGMRFVNDMEFRINGVRPLLLSSSIKEANEILSVDLTNPVMKSVGSDVQIPKDVIYIGRTKFIRNGACYEQFKFQNFGSEPYTLEASLSIGADFIDIFEVRGIKRAAHGEIYEVRHFDDNCLRISYLGLDKVKRFTQLKFSVKPSSWQTHNCATFNLTLAPGEQTTLEYTLSFIIGEEDEKKKITQLDYNRARKMLDEEVRTTNRQLAAITTSNQQFDQWIIRSQYDILSLLAKTQYGLYPYAGVPWYNTAFGRDGIITALETLWMAPRIAHDVLIFLARTQATAVSPKQDAEPGKVIHEIREGEMVDLGEIPFKRYYGSVDATPLFLMLAGAYYKRTADLETVRSIWPNLLAAMNWIDTYGDSDKDGFTDYNHKSENGLTNQGWKDSYDCISHANGELAKPPISLCEVQGYVYRAKKEIAVLAEFIGDAALAERLHNEANSLKERFNSRFWDNKLQCYVIALDGDGEPCRITASNAGHCLFTGIADEDKARTLARRFMEPDMYSGWGIRTLSTHEKRYNPMSYHNGSVWPHDVAIIAKGFSNYGLQKEVLTLTDGLFDASLYIDLQRLPELFCGFERRHGEGPTDYPVACSPQAWSVGAVFLLLEACLHLEIVAAEKKVYFKNPALPQGVSSISIRRLQLGTGYADIQLYCESDVVQLQVHECPDDWQIQLVKR